METLSHLWSVIDWALGLDLDATRLNAARMALRAAIVFVFALAIIRLGNKRFMGRHTAMDVMLGIVFGSVISRAITGNAPFFPTLAACVMLVALHWTMSVIAFKTDSLGRWFKGTPRRLVNEGRIDWREMARSQVTERDLKEAVRLQGRAWNVDDIGSAYLERDGDISVIFRTARADSNQNSRAQD